MGALVVGAGLVAAAPRLASEAQTPPPPPKVETAPCVAIASVEGKDSYGAYCAVCHGKDGRGHGPAAPALKMPMPDLTTLAQRSGGKFNFYEVRDAIESGGKMPSVHGTVDMPMWGPVFKGTESDRHRTELRLYNLVKYLESIQKTTQKT
jgi:mono/diheme cytochrome c family protein